MEKEERALRKKAIRRLTEELVDVLDAFGWHGIGGGEIEPADEAQPRLPIASENAAHAAAENAAPKEVAKAGNIDAAAAKAEYDEDRDDEDYGEDDDKDPYDTDPWEVRTAVDEGISSLMKADLIPGLKGKNAPSLSEVFGEVFGEGDEMTKEAEYFEELIAGYEDRVSMDDLKEAYEVLLRIVQKLKRKARWA